MGAAVKAVYYLRVFLYEDILQDFSLAFLRNDLILES